MIGNISSKTPLLAVIIALLLATIGTIIIQSEGIHAQTISGPSVSTWGPGHLNIFVIGQDHTLRYNPYFNGQFAGWQPSLGHPPRVNLTSDPAAVSWDTNRIDVFARGTDNKIWWIHYDRNTNTWSGWSSLPPISDRGDGVQPVRRKYLGFDSGNPPTWEWGSAQFQQGTTDRLVAVDKNSIQPPSIDPNGTKALRVTVQPNDSVSNGARAEVVLTNPLPGKTTRDFLPGEDVWYHWYTMFPSNLKIPNSWHVWTQWHQEADISTCRTAQGTTFSCGVIPMGFNFRNYTTPEPRRHSVGETIEFTVINKTDVNQSPSNPNGKGYGDDILWAKPLQRAHWYNILLHVKWEPCAQYATNGKCLNNNGGFVEMWVDGVNVVPKTTHFTMDEDGKVYLKQGLYHCLKTSPASNCAHIDYSQTLYHDGMKVAECPSTHVYFNPADAKCYATPR
jgi:hypothetical protein